MCGISIYLIDYVVSRLMRPVRPRLVCKSQLTKFTTPTPTPVTPTPNPTPVTPTPVDLKKFTPSTGVVINLVFVVILTFICLWLYHLYVDRKDTDAVITKLEDIQPLVHNIHPILMNPNFEVIPSNVEDVPETFNYV
jgi:hypothetical protein